MRSGDVSGLVSCPENSSPFDRRFIPSRYVHLARRPYAGRLRSGALRDGRLGGRIQATYFRDRTLGRPGTRSGIPRQRFGYNIKDGNRKRQAYRPCPRPGDTAAIRRSRSPVESACGDVSIMRTFIPPNSAKSVSCGKSSTGPRYREPHKKEVASERGSHH